MKQTKIILLPFAVLACSLSSCNSIGKGSLVTDNKECANAYLDAYNDSFQDVDNLGVKINLKDFKGYGQLAINLDDNTKKELSPRLNSINKINTSYHNFTLNNFNANIDYKGTNLAHDNKTKDENKNEIYENYSTTELKNVNFDLTLTDPLVDISSNFKDSNLNLKSYSENVSPVMPIGGTSLTKTYLDTTEAEASFKYIMDVTLNAAKAYNEKGQSLSRSERRSPLEEYCYDVSDNLMNIVTEYLVDYHDYSGHLLYNDLTNPSVLGSNVNWFENIANNINEQREKIDALLANRNTYYKTYNDFKTFCGDNLNVYKKGETYTFTLDLDYKLLKGILEDYKNKLENQSQKLNSLNEAHAEEKTDFVVPNFKGNVILELSTNKDGLFSNFGVEFKDFAVDTSLTISQIGEISEAVVEESAAAVEDITVEDKGFVKLSKDNTSSKNERKYASTSNEPKLTIENLNGKINIDFDYTINADDVKEKVTTERDAYHWEEVENEGHAFDNIDNVLVKNFAGEFESPSYGFELKFESNFDHIVNVKITNLVVDNVNYDVIDSGISGDDPKTYCILCGLTTQPENVTDMDFDVTYDLNDISYAQHARYTSY